MKRGEIILTIVANVGAAGCKVRPALVVQSDRKNARFKETIIAAITSNVSQVQDATQLLIDVATKDIKKNGSIKSVDVATCGATT
jgi:mRNA-degrading endonuclease toxin of MazEF toxin-antitoxin module